jgi:hypothetical protein
MLLLSVSVAGFFLMVLGRIARNISEQKKSLIFQCGLLLQVFCAVYSLMKNPGLF